MSDPTDRPRDPAPEPVPPAGAEDPTVEHPTPSVPRPDGAAAPAAEPAAAAPEPAAHPQAGPVPPPQPAWGVPAQPRQPGGFRRFVGHRATQLVGVGLLGVLVGGGIVGTIAAVNHHDGRPGHYRVYDGGPGFRGPGFDGRGPGFDGDGSGSGS